MTYVKLAVISFEYSASLYKFMYVQLLCTISDVFQCLFGPSPLPEINCFQYYLSTLLFKNNLNYEGVFIFVGELLDCWKLKITRGSVFYADIYMMPCEGKKTIEYCPAYKRIEMSEGCGKIVHVGFYCICS